MLRSLQENEKHLIAEDPVRPHIPYEKRFGDGRNVVVLEKDGKIAAIVCTALCDIVPSTEEQMFEYANPYGDVLVAYTVWSYSKGAGREIINMLRDSAIDEKCARLVTLSPLTEMAERFHIKNGAVFLARYAECQNFEYDIN